MTHVHNSARNSESIDVHFLMNSLAVILSQAQYTGYFVINIHYKIRYRTRALLGVCAYISTGSKPPLNSEYAPNSEMDNLIWMGIN